MYKDIVLQKICLNNEALYDSAVSYFLSKIEFVTGHRAFKSILIIEQNDEYMEEKKIFRTFTIWFLKNRAVRYILSGNMLNKTSYIKYKNDVMINSVLQPELWVTNMVVKDK